MPITWKKITWNSETNRNDTSDDGVTHVGCVVSEGRTRVVRVMSDIYSDETYCWVINPETLAHEEIHLGGAFECNTRFGHAVVDLTDDLKARADEARRVAAEARAATERAAAEVRAKAAARAKAAKDAKDAARAPTAPTKGRIVQVVRGKFKGLVGMVFWTSDSNVGIALSDERDSKTGRRTKVEWVTASVCDALPTGNSDEEVAARLAADTMAYEAAKAAANRPAPSRTAPLRAPF